MLTFDQLKKYYSDATIYSPKSMLVEYLQYEILDSIYKQKSSAQLSFIGGTAIRIVYGGGRFSEDLDFDNFGLSFDEFQSLMDDVVRDMQLKGFAMESRLVEKGAYHCYIKFPHILRASGIGSSSGENILVRIDTVRKEKTVTADMHTLNRFDIYRTILANPIDIILSQKLITILERKREKGRDLYDVSYLYGITEPSFSYIEKTLGITKNEFIEQLIGRCETFDFAYLAKDVEPFLMDPHQSLRVIDFKNFIRKQLLG
jgi:predicted nucleotidyltransferase component of viral defense system